MEVRLEDVSYGVPRRDYGNTGDRRGIHTVYNSSPLYTMTRLCKRLCSIGKGGRPECRISVKEVLSGVNLILRPGRMYLVLGPPQSGKTSLLKAIAGMLPDGTFQSGSRSGGYVETRYVTGKVAYNNVICSGVGAADVSRRAVFRNLVAFVGQNDVHAPRLTVAETLHFSCRCKGEFPKKDDTGDASTDGGGRVDLALWGLGLSHVRDTYVGNERIRGVSGGQRRRVTLGEMLVFDTPLLCGDEISTGEGDVIFSLLISFVVVV
jgi:ABC-type multidrug transport system ATPase subunit